MQMKKSMRKFSKFLSGTFAFLLLSMAAMAQNVISGKVTDSKDGSPAVGVTVTVKGTSIATKTDANGVYKISAPTQNAVLVFTSTEFGRHEGSGDVALVKSSVNLGEVVVVGYGTAKKKDLTGAVNVVSQKDFQKGAITTPEQMIAGKVAGVSIISNSGKPGAGSTIRVRGGSSLNASNNPLIVIDGVPLPDLGDTYNGASNPLSLINANDVESFTILKDASAAAIYGTRAANGVILITTKKGKGGKLKVAFSSVNSLATVIKKIDVLSADEIRTIVNAHGTAVQKASLGTANTDWQDVIYRNAISTDNNISFSGGVDGLPYRVSIGYQNQQGIVRTDKLEKISLALVANPTFFNNHLKVDINLKGIAQNTRFAADVIGSAIGYDPTQPIYSGISRYGGYKEYTKTDGSLELNAGRNPLGQLEQKFDIQHPKRSVGNIQFDYKFHFLPELRANLNLGYDVSRNNGVVKISDSAAVDYFSGGTITVGQQDKNNSLLEFYLNYAKDLKSIKSRIDVTAGYSYNDYSTTNYNFLNLNAKGNKKNSADTIRFPFDKPGNRLISFFGRAIYTLADKYIVTGTIRRDGSSRFAPENRWGVFPSVAFAWKMKDDFFKNSSTVSDLKLRLGYGVTGQQDGIGNYNYLAYYSTTGLNASAQFGDEYVQGVRPGGVTGDLKWEETSTSNIALDFGFLNNRISGSVDFYLKKTKDLLNSVPQAVGSNFSAYAIKNVGSMENKGVEFNLNVQPIRKRDMSWDANFNITYNKNTITNLTVIPNDPNYLGFPSYNLAGTNGFAYINAVGTPKNTFYLYKQIYDQATGKPIEGLFEDLNRDGIINDLDKYKGKTADPNIYMGFSTNFSYKKWNAGFVLRSSLNNYVNNNTFSNLGRLSSIVGATVVTNGSKNYLETGFTGSVSQLQGSSDYYLENASFLRMDNFNVGYNVGSVFNNKATLRTSLTVQNVFVITKYSGLDPEISSGVDNNFYPRPRVISLGLNLDF